MQCKSFNPDVIIAIGGGSPIDAAKGMWLFIRASRSRYRRTKT